MEPTKTVFDIGRRTIRRIAGRNSAFEGSARHVINRVRWLTRAQIRRRDVHVFRSGSASDRFGIYAEGACDLWGIVNAGRLLEGRLTGLGCVLKVGSAASARTDILLQSLNSGVTAAAGPILQRFGLTPQYFVPRLFEPTFAIPDHSHLGLFPKNVVVLSIAGDLSRVVYEHRTSGLRVDPGGWWLTQSLENVRARLGDTKWFAANFVKLGRIGVNEFGDNMRRLIPLLKERTGAHIVVLNSLVIEPGQPTPDYRLIPKADDLRRREFAVVLMELTKELEFSLLDVDRILKEGGTSGQADFIHQTPEQTDAVARELVRILAEQNVLPRAADRVKR
jgi:hypothetical protein